MFSSRYDSAAEGDSEANGSAVRLGCCCADDDDDDDVVFIRRILVSVGNGRNKVDIGVNLGM